MPDITYSDKFEYTHDNPYHDRLKEFEQFVLRDHEAEAHAGKWNSDIFKRDATLCVEIGSGYGHFMLDYCQNNPQHNFLGLDYRFKRSFNLAKKLSRHPHKNFKYLRAKGERLEFIFGSDEVDKIFYFFPDPWPKKKHQKKRLFQEAFLKSAYNILAKDGRIFVKTDHDGYAQWMSEVMIIPSVQQMFDIELQTFDLREEYPEHFLSSFTTKFEKIFLKQGIKIKAFVLKSRKGKYQSGKPR